MGARAAFAKGTVKAETGAGASPAAPAFTPPSAISAAVSLLLLSGDAAGACVIGMLQIDVYDVEGALISCGRRNKAASDRRPEDAGLSPACRSIDHLRKA